jgi:hypothetical protein
MSESFLYWECPDCQWNTVLRERPETPCCPLCASDNGRFIRLRARPARSDDRPEGPDERKSESVS